MTSIEKFFITLVSIIGIVFGITTCSSGTTEYTWNQGPSVNLETQILTDNDLEFWLTNLDSAFSNSDIRNEFIEAYGGYLFLRTNAPEKCVTQLDNATYYATTNIVLGTLTNSGNDECSNDLGVVPVVIKIGSADIQFDNDILLQLTLQNGELVFMESISRDLAIASQQSLLLVEPVNNFDEPFLQDLRNRALGNFSTETEIIDGSLYLVTFGSGSCAPALRAFFINENEIQLGFINFGGICTDDLVEYVFRIYSPTSEINDNTTIIFENDNSESVEV